MKKTILTVFLFSVFVIQMTAQVQIIVSTSGDDSNDGAAGRPVATFKRAQQLARAASTNDNVEVVFADGIYYLDEPIEFTEADNKGSVVYRAENEGGAIISGGSRLTLNWQEYKDGIYVADVEDVDAMDQLLVNGRRQRMARFPNAVEGKNVFDFWDLSNPTYNASNDALASNRIARWANPTGGFIHAMQEYLWGDMHWSILGKNSDGTLQTEGGWQNSRPTPMHGTFRFVENIFEELDVPGEWYFDSNARKLYYMPNAGEDLQTATIDIARLKNLLHFNGTEEHPVKNIEVKGFIFRHTSRTLMDSFEPLLRSDWAICRMGAILYEGAEDCYVSDCEFDQVGGNTIFASGYNRRLTIRRCHIHDSGASGIAFVGKPSSVWDPITNDSQKNYDTMSREPGTKSNDYVDDCLVEDCLIEHTGRDEKQTAGVQISMSHGIRVSHCSIYDVPRAGINISEGTFGGHRIEYCDIFNTVLETGDHGSFNSWGRDRYWVSNVPTVVQKTMEDPDLPFIDILDRSEICYSRWRCDHGWDIDLDDGSTNYDIHHNVLLNGGLKLREGFHRNVYNNVMINNSLNPHVWYINGEDQFYRNIVTTAYKPAAMTSSIAADGKWGKMVDYNFFAGNESERTAFSVNGCDAHSLNGYPMFVDSVAGDYRVQEGSPALSVGFENFDMDNFGVQKPSLKQIAKTPVIPDFSVNIAQPQQELIWKYYWMGVLLREPMIQEFSAYGVGFDEGGIAMTRVEDDSEAAAAGFKTADLLLAFNGVQTSTIQDLIDFLASDEAKKEDIVVSLVREQKRITITIHPPLPDVVVEEPAFIIPGRIEGEQYTAQSGVQTEDCLDEGGGLNVGYIHVGDWMEYPVDIQQAGEYDAVFRCACLNEGGTVEVFLDDASLTTITFKSTGAWQMYEDNNFIFTLPEGRHKLKFQLVSGGFNFNWFELKFKPQTTAYEQLQELIQQIDEFVAAYTPTSEYNSGKFSETAMASVEDLLTDAKALSSMTDDETLTQSFQELNQGYQELIDNMRNPGGDLGTEGEDLTEEKLIEATDFSRCDPDLGEGTTRFGLLGEPWFVTDNILNQDNYTHGGFDSYDGNRFISIEKWAPSAPAIENGKIYQTTNAELPAGKYTFRINLFVLAGFYNNTCEFRVVEGNEFPDKGYEANLLLASQDMRNGSSEQYYSGVLDVPFELASSQSVSFGWLANIPGSSYDNAIRISSVYLLDENGNDISSTYIANFENIQRKDRIYTRYGTPTYWTVDNFGIAQNNNYGTKNGIDSGVGYNCLSLGVWKENDVAVGDNVKNARIYRRVQLDKGLYFFGANFEYLYQVCDQAYIFASDDPVSTSSIKENSIAFEPINKATHGNSTYYGINFVLNESKEICLGFQQNLTKGPRQQEFLVKSVCLILKDPDATDVPTAIETLNVERLALNDNAVYDLVGRKVADNYELYIKNYALPKGIYIVNGKKIWIK